METRLKYFVLIILFVTASTPRIMAQGVETDPKLTQLVIGNTMNSLTWEQARNNNVEQQRKIQDSIMVKTSTLLTIKEVALTSLDNIDGFGYENSLYKQMYSHCIGITNSALQLITSLNDLKVDFMVVMEVGKLVDRAKDLAKAFSTIVTNGKVKSPIDNSSQEQRDGRNYIKRGDRRAMAWKIVLDLGRIRCQLDSMLRGAKYLTIERVFRAIDRDSWAAMWGGRLTIEIIKQRWSSFKHRY